MQDHEFKVGDVVYADGASLLLGDVVRVDEDGVEVCWRKCFSTEQPEDLFLASCEDERNEATA